MADTERATMAVESEFWEPVGGWPYEVSTQGRVRNSRTGHVLAQGLNHKGYPLVGLSDAPRKRSVTVHRLVIDAFVGPAPGPTGSRNDEWHVNHKDGDKENNCADNLEWVTRMENCAHASRLDLYSSGTEHRDAKLTPEKVREIRWKYATGKWSQPELASEYGVQYRAIFDVIHRKSWKHVTDEPEPVAWHIQLGDATWDYTDIAEKAEWARGEGMAVTPLYTSPPPTPQASEREIRAKVGAILREEGRAAQAGEHVWGDTLGRADEILALLSAPTPQAEPGPIYSCEECAGLWRKDIGSHFRTEGPYEPCTGVPHLVSLSAPPTPDSGQGRVLMWRFRDDLERWHTSKPSAAQIAHPGDEIEVGIFLRQPPSVVPNDEEAEFISEFVRLPSTGIG